MPVLLPCLNTCWASWIEMAILRQILMVVVIIYQVNSAKPMPLYYLFPFWRRVMVVQVISAGVYPIGKSVEPYLPKLLILPCLDSSPVWPL